MLVAELSGKPGLARTIWSWTKAHLGRADGLFAWHASGSGAIEDPQSASDADVLIAYALLRYVGADSTALHRAGARVATAVLAHESLVLPGGAPLVLAGPWAKTATPPTVNPSYLMPGVFAALARWTGDARWRTAATAAVSLVGRLSDGGRLLPPDWAGLSGSTLVGAPAPGGGAPVQYSLDAARLPVWFASGCDPGARAIAATWWRDVLSHDDRAAHLALSVSGATIDPAHNPLTLVAAAAGAAAAGDQVRARGLERRAAAVAAQVPSYYGEAWVVLGPAFVNHTFETC